MYTVLLVIHVMITVLLIIFVLMQRADSDGLSGLSGGGMNSFLTGRAKANFWTTSTAILGAAFIFTSLGLGILVAHGKEQGTIAERLSKEAGTIVSKSDAPKPVENKAAIPTPGKDAAEKKVSAPAPKVDAPKSPSVPKPE